MSRRYSSEQINDYELKRVVGPSGGTTGYRVLVAGDVLGTVERVAFRAKAWQALDTHRIALPHVGNGHYASNREAAVVDLLTGLGVA